MSTTTAIPTFVVLFLISVTHGNRLMNFQTAEDYMDVCMDGISHKQTPGPESTLFDKCGPWANRSCCTQEITASLHVNTTWYKMDMSHCPVAMSPQCQGRFTQDLCFYECSPNVGPWLVSVDGMKIRKERFVNVPLCRTECSAWWEDCKYDYTCIENWSRGFNWTTGTPKCPSGSECKTFSEVFNNSANFCEKVWDHSWKVVDDNHADGCFVMWWQTGADNPNYKVAYNTAKQIVSGASRVTVPFIMSILLCFCVSGFFNLLLS